ncbi:hypothetical protein SSPSH_003642 [Salinisphaera shabanensis E1L3A]|uniref:EpsG family protein n=1 Tax=Salinisphaera shabanensis E1L3A TaxID=1033802 RepID=U2EGM5_9GAMM|nr:EpsG family protein [Salinisphaera shabanensis]ERJ17537.1 hypothetical protein SSPSH_003642 [Salinisphaera shabanensis E1L3A]
MFVYWTLFLTPALLALARVRVATFGWVCLGALVAGAIGFRFQVGTDWGNYITMHFVPAGYMSLLDVWVLSDPLFRSLNWLAQSLGLGYWSINLATGIVFAAGLVRFVRRLPEPLLAFTAAIPYLAIVVAMNYTRQALALGCVLFALPYLYNRQLLAYTVTVLAASLFHRSAIIFLPLMALAAQRGNFGLIISAGLISVMAFGLILYERFAGLWRQYVESEFADNSQGAVVRVAMSALPALMWFVISRKVSLTSVERRVWTLLSSCALVAMGLVFLAPVAVDRVALYLSPIQLMVAAYSVQFFKSYDRVLARVAVIGVYAMVQYTWLVYGAHSGDWFPYRFWPFFSLDAPVYS